MKKYEYEVTATLFISATAEDEDDARATVATQIRHMLNDKYNGLDDYDVGDIELTDTIEEGGYL